VTGDWVAATVRARGLARRLIGPELLDELRRAPSLRAALDKLVGTRYERDVSPDLDLTAAQRVVSATLLWNLRILAGWGPAVSAGPLRVLAAGFEAANVVGHLARLGGAAVPGPYDLGMLRIAWPEASRTSAPDELRRVLARSAWGDPGGDDLPTVRIALELSWARQVLDHVPGAGGWAAARGALVLARAVAAGAARSLPARPAADADRLLGRGWRDATSVPDLAGRLRGAAAAALTATTGWDDLWSAEERWWQTVRETAPALLRSPLPGPEASVGAAGMLAADAWAVRGALAAAARGGGTGREVVHGSA
jgi:hypothetical protein